MAANERWRLLPAWPVRPPNIIPLLLLLLRLPDAFTNTLPPISKDVRTTAVFSSFGHDRLHFTHMAVDQRTGRVYAGANNHLFQLGPNLTVEHDVLTGPRNDSPLCHATGCLPDAHDIPGLKLTDNVNKVKTQLRTI